MAADNHYFYVLRCNDQSFYGGYTTDLSRRLLEHNKGIGAKYTRPASRRPLQMIHAESFSTLVKPLKQKPPSKNCLAKRKRTT